MYLLCLVSFIHTSRTLADIGSDTAAPRIGLGRPVHLQTREMARFRCQAAREELHPILNRSSILRWTKRKSISALVPLLREYSQSLMYIHLVTCSSLLWNYSSSCQHSSIDMSSDSQMRTKPSLRQAKVFCESPWRAGSE